MPEPLEVTIDLHDESKRRQLREAIYAQLRHHEGQILHAPEKLAIQISNWVYDFLDVTDA